ncbi:hypothetical protein GQ55_6G218300 [Panicum hallii var. hallii]|uniref:Uncharacterized protein n=1 Tax=Panicum hallii var. hallii TaxID=1504633 RepID=A0A2T7D883_9POAL|nr:hypothetical protein GQ55_6G218300 [Panicum hallii var. hallii]
MPVDVEAAMAPPPPASACSSSSIGRDSDECPPPGKEEEGEGEVQSAFTGGGAGGGGGGLAGLEALEEALPIQRSISKFYNGKSKSFACLKEAIASSGSAKDITKADNAYSRKRKNLLAYSIVYGNSHETSAAHETASPKRLASLSRNSLATLASSSSGSSSSISIEENELPEQLHSPLSPDNFISTPRSESHTPNASSAPMRSLSMMDLHRLHRSSSSVRLKDTSED